MPSIINRQYRTVENPDDAFDENGVLRDGFRVRVPMQLMDSRPAPRSAPIVIETGLRGTQYDLNRDFYWDGSPKPPRRRSRLEYDPDEDEDFIEVEELDANGRRRRRLVARDPMGREAGEYSEEDRALRDHRPGYRSHHVTAADRQRVADAYNTMVADLQTQWMTPEQKLAEARLTTDAAHRPRGMSEAEYEYNRYCAELTDAWRPKDGDYQPAREGAQAPRGIWPVGGTPVHLTSAKEGDPCFDQGGRGRLVNRGGVLFCELEPMPTTRADAVPRTMSVQDAQRIKDAAYAEYVERISNEWRS
jgi:hypothetical protein